MFGSVRLVVHRWNSSGSLTARTPGHGMAQRLHLEKWISLPLNCTSIVNWVCSNRGNSKDAEAFAGSFMCQCAR